MQMVQHATKGLVVFSDPWGDMDLAKDAWTQWCTYQAGRWLKSVDIIRPHEYLRQAFLMPNLMAKVRCPRRTCAPSVGGCMWHFHALHEWMTSTCATITLSLAHAF